MKHFRTAAEDPLDALDQELHDAVRRLSAERGAGRDLLRARIDELLDRRLRLQEETVIRSFEHTMSTS